MVDTKTIRLLFPVCFSFQVSTTVIEVGIEYFDPGGEEEITGGARVFIPSVDAVIGTPHPSMVFQVFKGRGGPSLSLAGGFLFFVLLNLCIFVRMVRRRRYHSVRIRSFPPYPRIGDAFSVDGGHVDLYIQWIS